MVAVGTSGGSASRLEMRGVRKRFGSTVALDGVDLAVPAGEVHALIGENGAGKSTLMKILSGAVRPDAGDIRLDGVAYAPRSPMDARRRGVAMIYQELSLAPHLTAAENISLGAEPARFGVLRLRDVRRRATDAMRQLGRADVRLDVPVRELSPADRQIVEIARALATGCRVLVLDEPTSSLARDDVARLFRLVRDLKRDGHAIVYISHFLEEVREVADSFTVLRDGRVAGVGRTADVAPADLVGLMVGRRIEQLYPRSERVPGEGVLELEELSGAPLPRRASLRLRRGEVLGIAGLVGAGRTELLRAVFGLAPVRSGRIRVGTLNGAATPRARLRQGVGLLSEDRKNEGLALSLSVAENVTLSRLDRLGRFGIVVPARQRAAAERWVERLGVRCAGTGAPVESLSGGNQQKVALARLLHHDVDVILLDEPTRGVDVASKAEIYRVIDRLAAGDPAENRPPKAVLMVSSYLPELLGVCDRVAVMTRGVLGDARPVAGLSEQALLAEAVGTSVAGGDGT